jgi:hypothetical protein
MAITSALVGRSVLGDKAMTWGTYTDGSEGTADDINTKLHLCELFFIIPYGSAAITDAGAVNETLPHTGATVSIIVKASQSGLWVAIGDAFA